MSSFSKQRKGCLFGAVKIPLVGMISYFIILIIIYNHDPIYDILMMIPWINFQIYIGRDDKGWWLCIRNYCLLDGPVTGDGESLFSLLENLGSQGLQKCPSVSPSLSPWNWFGSLSQSSRCFNKNASEQLWGTHCFCIIEAYAVFGSHEEGMVALVFVDAKTDIPNSWLSIHGVSTPDHTTTGR